VYSKLIVRSLAAAAIMMTAGSAMAVNLYGGGATFPAVPYVGDDYLNVTPNARLSTSAGNLAGTNGNGSNATEAGLAASSAFGSYAASSGNAVSYCQTGSGFGKTRLNTNSGAQGDCRDFSDNSPQGLSAASGTPDFIGTDSPYSTSDYNAFIAGANYATKQGVTQIPVLAGAIALTYDANGTASLPRTTTQVCQIYSGAITDWASVPGSGLSGTIKVVYRSDNSGTSFAFTSYLYNKCASVLPAGFAPNQNFLAAFGGSLPFTGVPASGNNNVVTTAKAAGGLGLGYADFGEVANQGAAYALVDGFDPVNFGTSKITLATADLVRGQVLNGATFAAVPAGPSAAIANCTFVVRPTATISNRYPIAAFTYLATYARANAQALAVRGLIQQVRTQAPPVGFAHVDGNPLHASQINAAVTGTTNNCVQ
jgi:phosphate transport system substrate-binding protein